MTVGIGKSDGLDSAETLGRGSAALAGTTPLALLRAADAMDPAADSVEDRRAETIWLVRVGLDP